MGEFTQYIYWKQFVFAYHNIIFMTLARSVIVNQKGGDCKSKMLLAFILVNPDIGARRWTYCTSKCLHRFCPQEMMRYGVRPPFLRKGVETMFSVLFAPIFF